MKTSLPANRKWMAILFIAALLAAGFYVGLASFSGLHGFPLDDAWIHQVYARNLALRGEWAFNPGQPSGGSTSPLWSVLLAVAYFVPLDPVIWAAVLGWLALSAAACLTEAVLRQWVSGYSPSVPWVGLFMLTEWHLVWASVSGMETTLFVCLILAVFYVLGTQARQYWITGLLIGLSTWVRPDGITLLGPALLLLCFESGSAGRKLKQLSALLGTFLAVFLPYLLFNLRQAGTVWPSTFSAKQAEYLASTGLPFLERCWSLFLPFLAGGGVILLPAALAAICFAWRRKDLQAGGVILWICGYLLMYAIRLPVNYQHGRYMIPAMAGYFLIGLWGLITWISGWQDEKWLRLLKIFWTVCLAAVSLVFLIIGGVTYQNDVAIIQTEMVETAQWVKENIPADNRVAAHDIGVMGYFSGHEIIDLAGLVNPEVIPIIRNEAKLAEYLDAQQVDILVTFPGWYPQLTQSRIPVYQSRGTYSPRSGGENMAVYRWKSK